MFPELSIPVKAPCSNMSTCEINSLSTYKSVPQFLLINKYSNAHRHNNIDHFKDFMCVIVGETKTFPPSVARCARSPVNKKEMKREKQTCFLL